MPSYAMISLLVIQVVYDAAPLQNTTPPGTLRILWPKFLWDKFNLTDAPFFIFSFFAANNLGAFNLNLG